MEELFDISSDQHPIYEMDQSEFVEKTQKLLNKIHNAYARAWHSRIVKESELPEEPICSACKGCGTITSESGGTLDCRIDNEEGECYTTEFDPEEVGLEIEELMGDCWELMSVEKVSTDTVK